MKDNIVESCEEFRSVGKIRKAHGIRGELFLISFSKNFDWLKDSDGARLVRKELGEDGEVKQNSYQFAIKKAKDHKIGRILKLEGIEDRNRAEEFEGAVFQVPQSLFAEVKEDEYYLLKLMGFRLFDQAGNLKGKVCDFASNGTQDLLVIDSGTHKFEVPYVDPMILKLDFPDESITMALPEGIEQAE